MILLPDTHILLWMASGSPRLSRAARNLLDSPDNSIVFSAVSVWEIAIKSARGDLDFQIDPGWFRRHLLAMRFTELPVTSEHAAGVYEFPPIHKDPFDRLLIAQATIEDVTLVTADNKIARYPGPIRKV